MIVFHKYVTGIVFGSDLSGHYLRGILTLEAETAEQAQAIALGLYNKPDVLLDQCHGLEFSDPWDGRFYINWTGFQLAAPVQNDSGEAHYKEVFFPGEKDMVLETIIECVDGGLCTVEDLMALCRVASKATLQGVSIDDFIGAAVTRINSKRINARIKGR